MAIRLHDRVSYEEGKMEQHLTLEIIDEMICRLKL
jgi:hypothetical protein